MNEKQKEQIRKALRLYVMKYPSQNKAAASLDGTSAGTVSSVLSGKCVFRPSTSQPLPVDPSQNVKVWLLAFHVIDLLG